ncbi:MAG: hypothetical protein IT481_11635 [Gammaproteobacteria bacterium]|nr:hypothetical protein [Gammaproteobacteria bacterium]
MREFLLVVPDLPPAAASSGAAAASAARALARLRFAAAQPLRSGWRAWVARRLGRPDLDGLPLAEVVAAAILPRETPGDPASPSGAWLATPLHLVAGLDTVHLPRDGIVVLEPAEREALAGGFAQTLGGGRLALLPAGADAFVVLGLDLDAARTVDPLDCLGGSLVDAQPAGPGAAALRRLMSEIEMWLHDHPVNTARLARGVRPVRALWLWGGTAPPRPATAAMTGDARPDAGAIAATAHRVVPRCVYADDAWTRAAARLAGVELAPEGSGPDALAFALDGDALVTARFHAEDPPDAAAFEARFLEPALAALRVGTLGRLTLVTADRAVAVEAGDRFRLWRPRRDWLTALEG